jgi:hypothetical protein
MRIIGRLSFPLFAWVLAQNWKRREPNSSAKPLITRLAVVWNNRSTSIHNTIQQIRFQYID